MRHPRIPGGSIKRRVLSTAALLLIALGVTEGASHLGLAALRLMRGVEYRPAFASLSEAHRARIRELIARDGGPSDPELGWEPIPSRGNALSTINSQGLRSDRDFELVPAGDRVRIAAFGCSYTFGTGVADHQTWTAGLERLGDRLEVLNFGVNAYGLDQAYLRYRRDGVRFGPRVVLIGFITDHVRRHVNVFRPFCSPDTSAPLSKPRFVLQQGRLALLPNPLQSVEDYSELLRNESEQLQRLGANDFFFRSSYRRGSLDAFASVRLVKLLATAVRRRINGSSQLSAGVFIPGSEPFRVTTGVLEAFAGEVSANGSTPLILIFPVEHEIEQWRQTGTKSYSPFLDFLAGASLDFIDMMEAFDTHGGLHQPAELFSGLHYNALGYEIVARHLHSELIARGMIPAP